MATRQPLLHVVVEPPELVVVVDLLVVMEVEEGLLLLRRSLHYMSDSCASASPSGIVTDPPVSATIGDGTRG
eukprot:5859427-Amphidinium_carterae.1